MMLLAGQNGRAKYRKMNIGQVLFYGRPRCGKLPYLLFPASFVPASGSLPSIAVILLKMFQLAYVVSAGTMEPEKV